MIKKMLLKLVYLAKLIVNIFKSLFVVKKIFYFVHNDL